jgi:hypothetical protein
MKKLILFSLFNLSLAANAEDLTRCYLLAIPHPDIQETNDEVIQEDVQNWCYRDVERGGKYIYNADGDVRPELAMTVNSSGTIKYGSLMQGEVTVQEIHRSRFNPLNVPLEEPLQLVFTARPPSAKQAADAEPILAMLQSHASVKTKVSKIEAGVFTATTDILPWHGFTWSFNDHQLYDGPNAPLAKYDRYVESESGHNPGTVLWESEHHSGGTAWGGHCNGWASSTILRKEPVTSVKDPQSADVFSISDQKGLLAVKDYCAKVAVYGSRNRSNKTDRKDIDPVKFHDVVQYFIGEVKKPIVIDIRANSVVNSQVASGYTMTIVDRGGGKFRVTADLTMHEWVHELSETIGAAPSYVLTYKYDLKTNAKGEIVSGKWRSANPDFIYNALSPGDCPDYHPGVSERYVQKILELPAEIPVP